MDVVAVAATAAMALVIDPLARFTSSTITASNVWGIYGNIRPNYYRIQPRAMTGQAGRLLDFSRETSPKYLAAIHRPLALEIAIGKRVFRYIMRGAYGSNSTHVDASYPHQSLLSVSSLAASLHLDEGQMGN